MLQRVLTLLSRQLRARRTTRTSWGMLLATGLSGLLLSLTSTVHGAEAFDAQSAWFPEVEELFEADVHCSVAAAARVAGDHVARRLAAEASEDAPVFVVVRWAGSSEAESERETVLEALREGIAAHDGSRVQVVSNVDEMHDAATILATVAAQHDGTARAGVLSIACTLPAGEYLATYAFVDKPWVQSSTSNESQGVDRNLIRVFGLGATPDGESTRDILVQAVDEVVLPRALDRLKGSPVSTDWGRRAAREALVRNIAQSPLVVDRFQQTFHKTVDGTDHVVLVREAVLLDLSPQNVARQARLAAGQVRQLEHRRIGGMTVGVLGVLVSLVVGLLMYRVLNAVTKGYYVWPLRAATGSFVVLAVVMAVRMASAIFTAT